MKRIALLSVLCALLFISCKEERFPEPDTVFGRWSSALKNLNYQEYRSCEAYPREEGVFREMFRHVYYTDCAVREFDDLDEENVKKNPDGDTYLERKVLFQCTEVRRKNGKASQEIRGDVMFVRFLSGKREKDGWLMWNRTMYRVEP